jgi:uncharacterized LabA/DUF88 family protein
MITMFVAVFIDFENIEKTAKQNYGCVFDYEKLVAAVREVAGQNGARVVKITAYGDFDKGEAGLQTRLIHLGIEPRHVVTKTAHEYLKGSTDIELSLDILETMYDYPHITDFLLISGDGDLRHVIRRLQLNGKNIRIMGFRGHTSKFIRLISNDFSYLDDFPEIMRKVTRSEKEERLHQLKRNQFIHQAIQLLHWYEEKSDIGKKKKFIGLNLFRNQLIKRFPEVKISDALTECLDNHLISTYKVDNPDDPSNPTTACTLNRENPIVKEIIAENQ